MASRLSNELIREILLRHFHVPDIMFRDISPTSPFFRLSHQPTSVVLLVCKGWMMVATPLLYEVVVLRSKAQTQALERSLRAHRYLGTFVRKLRVEGGFGAAMHSVLTCSPNVTDLCLSLDLRSSDSVAGLVRSLDTINPACLIIVDPRETEADNTPLSQLVSKLVYTFEKWTNLNEVYVSGMEDHIQRWYQITSALPMAKNLCTITVPFLRCTEDAVQELKECPSLELIRIVVTESVNERGNRETPRRKAFQDCIDSDRRLRDLVMFESPPGSQPLIPDIPVPDRSYVPMAHVSDKVRDLVWNRVLSFVFGIDLNNVEASSEDILSYAIRDNNRLLRVSKAFHRLSLPYAYGFLTFLDNKSLEKYTASIIENPSLGGHLRSLGALPSFSELTNPVELRGRLHAIFELAPNLTKLHVATPSVKDILRSLFQSRLPITLNAFRALAETAGPRISSILDMELLGGPKETLCPSVLHQFQALRSLRCNVTATLDLDVKKILQESLPALESLKITGCTPSFLAVISVLHLPSLREFEIKYLDRPPSAAAFLKVHGSKIETLAICPKNHLKTSVFNLCPNMTCLKMYFSPDTDDRQYLLQAAHGRLKKLIFDRRGDTIGYPATESPGYISTLRFTNFPALREIQVTFLDWPVTEFEISRSKWPECSELLASQNVKLTDGAGRSWRPRLKVHKA